MPYPFSEDHDMIRQSVKGWLNDWYDAGASLQRIYDDPQSTDIIAWQDFARQQGLAAISIPEAYGGAGLGQLGRAVIMEEAGYTLFASPFFSTCCLAADLIEHFADETFKKTYLCAIAAGDMIIAFADGRGTIDHTGGEIEHVIDASIANYILLATEAGDEVALYLIDAKAFTISPQKTMGGLRNLARVASPPITASPFAIIAPDAFAQVLMIAQAALAYESLGGAQRCMDIVLDYTAQRVQFDRPIASFQAIKHRCADMYIALESARSAAYGLAIAMADEAQEAALIARGWCHEAYFKIAGDAIQLHGGIGFTWEYPLHYFFKRARHNRALFGAPVKDYEALIKLMDRELVA